MPRTFTERLAHSRIYACGECGLRQTQGTWFSIDKSPWVICPSCGTDQLTRRMNLDPIEKIFRSPMSFLKRIFGGQLYRCRFCRLQFYDSRNLRVPRDETSDQLQLQGQGPR